MSADLPATVQAAVPPVPPTVAPAAPPPTLGLYEPAATPAEIAAGVKLLREVACAVLEPTDIAPIGQRPFIKKSGWQRLAMTFGVQTYIAAAERLGGDAAHGGAWRVTMRAVKSHYTVERSGLCTLAEKTGIPPASQESVAMATAETRAAGRALSALFGLGDISAEEARTTGVDSLPSLSPLAEIVHAHQVERGTASAAASEPASGPNPSTPEQAARLAAFGCTEIPATSFEAAVLIGKYEKAEKSAKSAKPATPATPEHSPDAPAGPAAPSDQDDVPKKDGAGPVEDAPAVKEAGTKPSRASSAAPAARQRKRRPAARQEAVRGRSASAPAAPASHTGEATGRASGAADAPAAAPARQAEPTTTSASGGTNSASSSSEAAPESCTCEGQDARPSPPVRDWDESSAEWECLRCGGRLTGSAAHWLVARLRGAFAALTTAGSSAREAEEKLGYPRPPSAVDLNAAPTGQQAADLAALRGPAAPPIRDGEMPAQIHVWAAMCAVREGRA